MTSCDKILAEHGAVCYDLEIVAAIPAHGELRDPSLHYCAGWDDHAGMGISVITAYDWRDDAYLVYLQDGLNQFSKLVDDRGILIGFNNHRFDDKVCRATGIPIPENKSYDLWIEIVNTQPPNDRVGFKLANMLEANGLAGKTGYGAEAPKLAQTGQWTKLINYCLADTKKQVQLMRLAATGLMRNPKNGSYMTIRQPWEVVKVERGGIFG